MGERSDAWRGQSTPPGPLEMQVKIKTAGFLAGDSAFLIIAHKLQYKSTKLWGSDRKKTKVTHSRLTLMTEGKFATPNNRKPFGLDRLDWQSCPKYVYVSISLEYCQPEMYVSISPFDKCEFVCQYTWLVAASASNFESSHTWYSVCKKEKKMHMILHKGTSSIRNRVVENISCGRECTSLLLIELQWCEIALHCSTILENCSRIRKDNMRKVHLRVGGAGSLHDLLISQDREDYTHMMQRSSTKFNSHDREKTGVGRKDSSEIPCKCRQHDMLLQVCSFQIKSTEWNVWNSIMKLSMCCTCL